MTQQKFKWFFFLIFLGANSAFAAPKAEIWPRWQQHNPASKTLLDHSSWQQLLDNYHSQGKDGIARFDYGAVTKSDKQKLTGYLTQLAATPVSSLTRPEQMAYWINLYNALTVQTILQHYPVKSIREINISPGWFTIGPWGAKQITVEGEKISLDDIEHRILRPIWRDPRIHYAVNCASLGCPDLADKAYHAQQLDSQLDQAAHAFIREGRGLRFDENDLVLSSIYSWFREDFGKNDQDVLAHLRAYAESDLLDRLEGVTSISDHEYDWRLNAPAP